MCGISGIAGVSAESAQHKLIETIVADQISRGPDAQAIETIAISRLRLTLGHNRLSIIDLSEAANQPMSDASGRLTIVFNGEIYNYIELRAELERAGTTFSTKSDTEVILESFKRFGLEAFPRLTGMFAMALVDRDTKSLHLVRDRFGVKPLYWCTKEGAIAFASSGRVLAQWANLNPDLDYCARGLAYKLYDDDEEVAQYEGLHAVPPGHALSFDLNASPKLAAKTRWYDANGKASALAPKLAGKDTDELKAELLSRLERATEIRLRSDVPVGVSLSGGIDSAAVTALARRLTGQRVTAYSFSHPKDNLSEGPAVEAIARHTDTEVRYVWPTTSDEIIDLFWKTFHAQDAPFPSTSVMAQFAVFEQARSDGTIVLLGGQGGDEAFMGYRKFFLFYWQDVLRRRDLSAIPSLALATAPFIPAVAARAGLFWGERNRFFRTEGRETRLRLDRPAPLLMGLGGGMSMLERQILDVTRLSLPTLLRYEDRNSMGNSIESRLPFMDQNVIEFGLALPVSAKLRNGFGKWLLRSALRGHIPESVRLNRDKRGFDVNHRRWINLGLGAEIRRALHECGKNATDLLNLDTVIDSAFDDNRLANEPIAFAEAVTLLWLARKRAGHD